jgi:hypothetical protein
MTDHDKQSESANEEQARLRAAAVVALIGAVAVRAVIARDSVE